ncbi:hypothetical protein SVAN01_02387 [Stagonosporopsis vannaccii]|nr:hypothetical protein SVAN01_02387 [Stagonosporopsis vannaccii]
MRNIRLDALPNNRPLASRDCALCTRRRIRCDRTSPSCLKCASRNLICPGFSSINLRWNQGVASRGQFAGSEVPVRRELAPMVKASMRRHRAQGYRNKASQTFQMQVEVPGPLLTDCDGSSEGISSTVPWASQDCSLVHRHSRFVLLGKLFDHFIAEVVPRLTWIELPGNLWPTALPTLAQGSECLSLSLTCLAAAHLSATRAGTRSEDLPFHQLHVQLRELSLRSVNISIKRILTNHHAGPNDEFIRTWLSEALASMVALCYSEVFIPNPTRWKLHLRGCQTVIDQLSLHRGQESERPVEMFLIKEVADLEALSAFSTFNLIPPSATSRGSVLTCSNSFWGFTGLIREITYAERKRQRSQQDQHMSAMDIATWHARADESYLGILSNISKMFSSHKDMGCFEQVVRAHHYATIIYSYHALAPETLVEATVMVDGLFGILEGMFTTDSITMKPFWHDMFFPLLIAGAQCSADESLQSMIERLFLTALSISGAWCNDTSLRFLRSYWKRPNADADMTWIEYARNEGTQTGGFIVF